MLSGKKVLEIYDKMQEARGNMPALWEEVIRYCFPQERVSYSAFGGNTKEAGWKRANPVCSYPVVFTQRLGSSIHSNAFPTNDYWFTFALIGEDASEDEDLRAWCEKARDIVHAKIRQGTNFFEESHAMMVGLSALGTAGFYTYYKRGKLHFRYIPIHKNFYIYANSDGEIDMVALLHEWTAKEAIEEYGRGKVSEQVVKAFESGAESSGQTYSYVQLVYPKKLFGESYGKNNKPYGDVTVETETGQVVKTAEHSGFPFAVPRFFVYSDDIYGRSPAMNAMPDIRAVNSLRKTLLDATVRSIKPPLFMDATAGDVSLNAGALNIVNGLNANSIWTPPLPTDFQMGEKLQAEIIESLKGAFYIDVFQAIEQQKYMTATEVTERVTQKVESISPIITRIQKEFSSRVILRCLDLLIENGDIPPPPIKDSSNFLKIAYVSKLDAMIQQGIAAKTMNFINQLNLLGQTVQNLPDLARMLNVDRIVSSLAESNTLPAGYIRPSAEVNAERMQVAQQQQAMAEAQVNSLNAKSAADLATAQKTAGRETLMQRAGN